MKRSLIYVGGVAVAAAALLASTLPSAAQNAAQRGNDGQNVQERTRQTNRADRRANMQNRADRSTVRASQIIGHNIVNSQNENVGEINDLVLSPMNGRIRYAAVTYGGFAGIGDKMFAVPWEAFECRTDPEDPDEYVVMLNVTQEQLEGAQGFNQDNWPDFANRQFTSELDRRYGVERNRNLRENRRERNRNGVGVDVNRNGVDVDVDRDEN
jgi:sporulation protein YlmC with PRC-barrel domain